MKEKTKAFDYASFVASRIKSGEAIKTSVTYDQMEALVSSLDRGVENGEEIDANKKVAIYQKEVGNYEGRKIPDFTEEMFEGLTPNQCARIHSAAGLLGEAGEYAESVLDEVYHGKVDKELRQEELGDILFFVQEEARELGLTLEDLILSNVAKLSKRYPAGYSDADAQARADKVGE